MRYIYLLLSCQCSELLLLLKNLLDTKFYMLGIMRNYRQDTRFKQRVNNFTDRDPLCQHL